MLKELAFSSYRFLLIFMFLSFGKSTVAQTFDVYIANDSAVNATTYEFDVFLRSTSSTIWAFRTIQLGFYVDPSWLPVGASPTITYVSGSSTLLNYIPSAIQMNASPNSLSAFQVASNLAGTCGTGTVFSSIGQTEKVGRFSIVSNSGTMNCVPNNISMIRPTLDSVAGTNVSLKMAVTKWSDANCNPALSVLISANGTYTSIAGNTLLSEYNNMAPIITSPHDTLGTACTITTFSVLAHGVSGQSTPVSYQWYENGSVLTNNSLYSGVNTAQLTLTNPTLVLDGKKYYVTVSQCNEKQSAEATLTITPCTEVATLEKNIHLLIYPNPTQGKINIRFNTLEKPSGIEILNLLNQTIYKNESDFFQNSINQELTLPLSTGTYIVKLMFKNTSVEKIIVVD